MYSEVVRHTREQKPGDCRRCTEQEQGWDRDEARSEDGCKEEDRDEEQDEGGTKDIGRKAI